MLSNVKAVLMPALIGLVGLSPQTGIADDRSNGQFAIDILNDIAFQTDKDYTNGLLISWTPSGSAMTWRLGQDIYTPTDLTTLEPIDGEHPYAGWLYLGFDYKHQISENWLANLTIDAGTTGPRSGAEDAQRYFHRITGSDNPAGWDSQIYDQWGVISELKLGYRIPFLSHEGSFLELRTQPYLRGRGGKIVSDYGVGLNLTVGNDIPAYSALVSAPDSALYWYVRANVERIQVEKNILLEGNTKTEAGISVHSYGVVPEKDVTAARLGLFVGLYSSEIGLDIRYTSRTFTTQVFDTTGASSLVNNGTVPDGDYISALTFKRIY